MEGGKKEIQNKRPTSGKLNETVRSLYCRVCERSSPKGETINRPRGQRGLTCEGSKMAGESKNNFNVVKYLPNGRVLIAQVPEGKVEWYNGEINKALRDSDYGISAPYPVQLVDPTGVPKAASPDSTELSRLTESEVYVEAQVTIRRASDGHMVEEFVVSHPANDSSVDSRALFGRYREALEHVHPGRGDDVS